MSASAKFTLVIFAMLLISTANCFAQSFENPPIVNGTEVRIRENPGTKGKVIGLMEIGTPVKILEKSKTKEKIGADENYWVKVELSEGINFWQNPGKKKVTGWVFGSFLTEDVYADEFVTAELEHQPSPQISCPELWEKMKNYSWDEADSDQYIPCMSYSFWIEDRTISFYYYECHDRYRILSVESIGERKIAVKACKINLCKEEAYPEQVPFPVKTETILLEADENWDELTVTRVDRKETFNNYSERGYVVVSGTDVQYRRLQDESEIMDIGDDYEKYPVAGKWENGQILEVVYVSPGQLTLNEKTGDWFVVKVPGADTSWFTFGAYLSQPDKSELLAGLPFIETLPSFWGQIENKSGAYDSGAGIIKLKTTSQHWEITADGVVYYFQPFAASETSATSADCTGKIFYWDEMRGGRLTFLESVTLNMHYNPTTNELLVNCDSKFLDGKWRLE